MATNTPTTPQLGSLVRMRALKPVELPAHPALATLQGSAELPPLKAFLSAVLDEGHGFVAEYLPATFKVKGEHKSSPPSKATVRLMSHEISAHDIPEEGRSMGASENWFARTSVHENAAKEGTASWAEFDGGLRADHSKHESDYTPDVVDAHKVLDWEEELAQTGRDVGQWQNLNASVMEMLHNLPTPLNKRVFSVLVVTAQKDKEFLVVQIPVVLNSVSGAKYVSNSKITPGMYCSVERGELIEDDTKVRWHMATASDAKGALPMWMQKLGVPGAVVKDVGLFIDWCQKRRAGKA